MRKNDVIECLINDLHEIKLHHMAESLEELYHSKEFNTLDHVSLLERLIEPEYEETTAKQYENRLTRANLKGSPQVISNCKDSSERSYLPSGLISTLSTLDFVRDGLNICILGPSDSGKTYLAKALSIQACQKYRVSYQHCESFLEEMVALKDVNFMKYKKKIRYYTKMDLMVLDDFLLHTITDEREIKVLHDLLENRTELCKSTIVCSQREPKSWASMILNDEVSYNAIMKRATKHYTVVIQPKE